MNVIKHIHAEDIQGRVSPKMVTCLEPSTKAHTYHNKYLYVLNRSILSL